MAHRYAETMFTPAVKDVQSKLGSRRAYERLESGATPTHDRLGADEREFIAARDSFYMATVSETGWPYVQHRGGPVGFLKVLDEKTIAFADYKGNRQYVSVGNLLTNDRVSLFLMDYPQRTRLKLLGHARSVALADDPALALAVRDERYGATAERVIVIAVHAFDWNCSQHITPRFTEAELAPYIERLRDGV